MLLGACSDDDGGGSATSTTLPEGLSAARCVVRLHGKSETGAEAEVRDGVAELAPTGNGEAGEGHEWVYVLTGRLRLLLGDRDLVLAEGEVAEFDTRTPHALLNPGPGPTELLTLFGPQGERMHVRARTRRRDDAS